MRIVSVVAVAAVLFARPAGAAIVDTRDVPADLGSLSIEQRATVLPPETRVVFHGKTTTLRALRVSHLALLAHFARLGALKVTMPPFVRVPMTVKKNGLVVGTPSGFSRVNNVGSTSSTTTETSVITSTPSQPMTHVPNAATQPQPIDYVAACGKISLCVYLPPYHSYDQAFFSGVGNDKLTITDPLLSADVCAQDGGVSNAAGCSFIYMTTAKISVSPGNPPNLQSSVNCPTGNGAYAVIVDPLGAAEITGNVSVLDQQVSPGGTGSTCAVDLMTPS